MSEQENVHPPTVVIFGVEVDNLEDYHHAVEVCVIVKAVDKTGESGVTPMLAMRVSEGWTPWELSGALDAMSTLASEQFTNRFAVFEEEEGDTDGSA